ncbi:response regulator [Aureibaculum luteum]|uniref:response regulator n=1 Tax=Aureibaculum luteum TaxID=1548456 RepID=UPI000E4F81CE|nr:response regulator [Aureibaculum luteum]
MKKILLIEDDIVVRENTAELLELANYEVFTAADGKMGITKANTELPDVIICDIMMPEINGYEVLNVLSKTIATQHIPFIFLSAKTEYSDIRKGMDMGADDYLTKPFNEAELISAIESRIAKVALLNENSELKSIIQSFNSDDNLKTIDQLKNYFSDNAEEVTYNLDETIYREGDNSNYIYLIYKGVVKTSKTDEQGKELITALHKGDDFFGLTSLTLNRPYKESAIALEKTEIFRLVKNDFKDLLLKNHALTLELLDYSTENVTEIKDQLLQMAYSSVRKKTANTILQFAEKIKKHPKDGIRISRSDLASVAGIATETFIRTLTRLKKDGIIDIEGRNIKVIDIDLLKQVF